MTEYKIIISENAYKDLDIIYNYISFVLLNEKSAKNIIQGILKKIDSLKYFPERFQIYKNTEFRNALYKNYNIFYEIDLKEKQVNASRIIHSARNIEKLI